MSISLAMDVVWWVNKELVFHAAEIWFLRDPYVARQVGGTMDEQSDGQPKEV